MPSWNEWWPYVMGFLGLWLFIIARHVDRIGKAQDRIIRLLLHIREVEAGFHRDIEIEQELREEDKKNRWKWLSGS